MDDISLVGEARIDPAKGLTSGQATETYKLAMAAIHGGRLASFERRLAVNAVKGGQAALHLIASVCPPPSARVARRGGRP